MSFENPGGFHLASMTLTHFVEKVLNKNGRSGVVQIAVHENDAFDLFELGKSEVGRHGSVAALFAVNAETDVGFLNHAHVVGSISNCSGHRLGTTVLDQFDNLEK